VVELASNTTDNNLGTVTPLIDRKAILAARRRDYEIIFILSPSVDASRETDLLNRVKAALTESGGEFLRLDDWGKLRMAYEINKHLQGHYFYLRFLGNGNVVKAVERIMKLDPDYLRFQSVRLSDDLSEAEMAQLRQKVPTDKVTPPHVEPEYEGDFVPGFRS